MVSEYKTLKDATVSDRVVVERHGLALMFKPLFKGKEIIFGEDEFGRECTVSVHDKWRYPIDPLEELENKILEKWQSQGVDFANDELKHIPHRWILQTLIDAGADVDAI